MERDAALLRDVAAFAGLTRETLAFLLERADTVEVAAGDHFFAEGEQGDSIFILEAGVAAVDRSVDGRVYRVRTLDRGACFGEIAVLSIVRRTAAVRAIEDCVAVRITAGHLRQLYAADLGQFTMLVMNLGREVCRRFVDLDRRYFERIALELEPLSEDPEDQG